MSTTLRLSLESADGRRTLLATLQWPEAVEAEAKAFIRDNLITERAGSTRAAVALMKSCRVEPGERARFLADKRTFLPEPPEALAAAVDLEELAAEFGVALRALRDAPPELAFVLDWA